MLKLAIPAVIVGSLATVVPAGATPDASTPNAWARGSVEEGSLRCRLYRGAAVPFEITVVPTPNNCEGHLTVDMSWSQAENRVRLHLHGRGALEPFPSVDRTPGVNYVPNAFFRLLAGGTTAPIVLELANEDGSIHHHEVTFDVGLAATTARTVDIGRFKVPQLRNLAANAPYFHDNSAATIEEVVDYFNSAAYNESADGRFYPVHLGPRERRDLIAFLRRL